MMKDEVCFLLFFPPLWGLIDTVMDNNTAQLQQQWQQKNSIRPENLSSKSKDLLQKYVQT